MAAVFDHVLDAAVRVVTFGQKCAVLLDLADGLFGWLLAAEE